MKITVLGSGGWIPTQKRETCSYMVEVDNNLIILDAGTGISRLKSYQDILKTYKTINIILSHYHLDHIIGLSFLPLWSSNHNINIWAPGKRYYKQSSKKILKNFTSFPYFSKSIDMFSPEVNIYEYDEKGFNIGKTKIMINLQKHSAPSFGITIGKFLHYATDTEVLKSTFNIANNVKILLHECWEIEDNKSNHSSLEQIIKMSKKCKNTKIGLIHINPSWGKTQLKEIKNILKNNNIFIIKDKMELNEKQRDK